MNETDIAAAWVEAFERLRSNPISQPVRVPIDYRGRSIPKWGEYLELRRSELGEFRGLFSKVAAKLAAAGETAEAKLLFSMERCAIDDAGLVTFPLVPMASAMGVCSAVKVMAALSATEPLQLGGNGHGVVSSEAAGSFKTRDDTDAMILTSLLSHHKYDSGRVGKKEPIVAVKLAKAAGVSPAAVSGYWKRKFRRGSADGGYQAYQHACRNGQIEFILCHLNGDLPALDVHQAISSRRGSDGDD